MVVKRLDIARQVLVASPELLMRQGTPETLEDLTRLDSIAMSAPDGRATWHLTGPQGAHQVVHHHPRYVADDLLTLKFAALAGTGMCWLPDYMCHEEMRDGRLVRVLPEWAPTPGIVHAVFPSRRGLSPAVRSFLDYLGEAMPGRSSQQGRS
jgi:DNA-binding transcriptional LysR family regulator